MHRLRQARGPGRASSGLAKEKQMVTLDKKGFSQSQNWPHVCEMAFYQLGGASEVAGGGGRV